MAISQRMEMRQGQALAMTPQLQQAIKLLTMGNLELQAHVELELESNPMLERADAALPGPDAPLATDAPVEEKSGPSVFDADEPWLPLGGSGGASDRGGGGGDFDDDLPSLADTLSQEVDLRQHLLSQLATEIADPTDRLIGAQIVDLMDEAGYIPRDLEPVATLLGCDPARVEATLAQLQQFDPPGILARDLKECLALQLRERNRLDPAMQALIDNLDLLAKGERAALLDICGVDHEDLADMAAEIRALDPKPAVAFDRAPSPTATPDIFVHRLGDGWVVELNNETLPRVLVDRAYYARVNATAREKTERDYVTERYRSATWLVKALEQRATTILKVASEIVRRQDGFLRHGVQHLQPLVRREVAAEIGMHESTVSRVTTDKYMATPRGVYELSFFFGASIAAADGTGARAAAAVRSRLRQLIDAERPDQPLSDDRLVECLRADGTDIARRTVAKYRESMQIPSSPQRRRGKLLRI